MDETDRSSTQSHTSVSCNPARQIGGEDAAESLTWGNGIMEKLVGFHIIDNYEQIAGSLPRDGPRGQLPRAK